MRVQKSNNVDFQPWGLSPLGGNGQEATATGFAPVRTTGLIEIPLVYDSRVDSFISKLASRELDDKEHALRLAEKTNEDENFRRMAGLTH